MQVKSRKWLIFLNYLRCASDFTKFKVAILDSKISDAQEIALDYQYTQKRATMWQDKTWTAKEQLEVVHAAGDGKSGLLLRESQSIGKENLCTLDTLCSPEDDKG